MDNAINTYDEGTPLLTDTTQPPKEKRTPLPKLQISILLLVQLCEPICSYSISPYINELVSTLGITGGDERKVGYYTGLIQSLFYVTEALTVFQWSRISDRVGRKPVLMLGLLGMMLSALSFGLSRTFAMLVISRCLSGLLNGNIGVVKSAMRELTDTTNRAEAFALISVVWGLGGTIGPLLGGTLARPSDRFPSVFTSKFWREYPYFLPCLATSAFVLLTLSIACLFFKETSKTTNRRRTLIQPACHSSEVDPAQDANSNQQHPVPFRGLLTYPVIISIANYMALRFLESSFYAILPLFYHMPLDMGGLDLDPAPIGYLMGLYGCGSGLFQIFIFAKIVRVYGIQHVYIMSILTFIPVFMMFPIINLVAKQWGLCWIVWALIATMLCLLFSVDTACSCIFMYVSESAPNDQSLGATNGLAQTAASTASAIAPVLSTSLFSFSVQRNILGGYGVYPVFAGLSLLALLLAIQLPDQLWTTRPEDGGAGTETCKKNV